MCIMSASAQLSASSSRSICFGANAVTNILRDGSLTCDRICVCHAVNDVQKYFQTFFIIFGCWLYNRYFVNTGSGQRSATCWAAAAAKYLELETFCKVLFLFIDNVYLGTGKAERVCVHECSKKGEVVGVFRQTAGEALHCMRSPRRHG